MTAAGVKVPKVLWTLVLFVVAHSVQLNTDGFSVKDLVLHFGTRLQPSLAPVLTFSSPLQPLTEPEEQQTWDARLSVGLVGLTETILVMKVQRKIKKFNSTNPELN